MVEIVHGNIDEITESIRARTGNPELTTSDVLQFFCEHPRPPTLRSFMAQARENTLGWANELRPLAPFESDIAKAVERCFNAYGGRKVERWELKTYADLFADFHRRPEYKYTNADDIACGETERRTIAPSRIDIIGKETLRYSREDSIGRHAPTEFVSEESGSFLRSTVARWGVKAVARGCGKSDDTIRRILNGEQWLSRGLADQLMVFRDAQEAREHSDAELMRAVGRAVKGIGLRPYARQRGVHPGHLYEMLVGRRIITCAVNRLTNS